MPGISQRLMRIRERVTRWRLRGGLALGILAPAIAVAAAPVPAAAALAAPAAPAAVPGPPSGWSTVFSDDFSGSAGSGIDSPWMYDTRGGSIFRTGEIAALT